MRVLCTKVGTFVDRSLDRMVCTRMKDEYGLAESEQGNEKTGRFWGRGRPQSSATTVPATTTPPSSPDQISRERRAPLVLVLVPVVVAVAVTVCVDVVGLVEDGVATGMVIVLESVKDEIAAGRDDVYGLSAVDSEEMSEERAERTDAGAVVSNERVLNGRPLVLYRG